ncbi:hypothetical protein [Kitasatospora sp. NPDC051914]|uniref:hypothetical protein n=1 Tax=Kitasatospora sp. NPDC051914 TaxID=3154945 RepID=UPI00343F25E9
MPTTPTPEQINTVVAFIDRCAREARDRVFAVEEVGGEAAEGIRRTEAGLHIATVHLGGTALYELTQAPEPNARTVAVCWEALTKTAQTWVEHPGYPAFLPRPDWAR